MGKIQFLREIDVKSRNFLFLLHKFLGILLISAYGPKSKYFRELFLRIYVVKLKVPILRSLNQG